jgi:pseudaminic acid biosynthesis-associated methylase
MTQATPQIELWSGDFGREYVERNIFPPDELDALYLRRLGVTRRALNERFLGDLDREARILEIGSNVGNQLRALAAMGFCNLYGIEPNAYALERARSLTQGLNLIQGSAFDIPFRDGWFDVVFTSGVLIHISLADLPAAQREIHRCSARYIWGYEYWAPQFTGVTYRGRENAMWKGDYAASYLAGFPDLTLRKQELLPNVGTDLHDCMFLLEKNC